MRVSLLCVAVLLLGTGARAQAPAGSPASPSLASPPATGSHLKNVSLDASALDVREALRSLAGQSGARILPAPELSGKITARLDNVSLEVALSTIASVANARWSGLSLPPEKAEKLTPDQAALLVAAADTLLAVGTTVANPGMPAVAVTETPPSRLTVFYVQPKSSAAPFTLERSNSDPRAASRNEADWLKRVGYMMSEDARQDASVVRAYDAIRQMEPNQIALLAREYLLHSSPEQRTAVVKAIGESQEQWNRLPGMP